MDRKIILLLLMIGVLMSTCCFGAEAVKQYKNQSKWRMKEFMISTWGTPNDETSTKMFADTGFNVVMAGPDMLDLLHKYNMKAIVMYVTPETVAKIKNHPAIWGYYVRDEPWNQADYDKVAAEAEAIRKVDDTKPCYVNLGGAMEQHGTFMNTIKPDFLSFDFYQWWWRNTFGPHHFSRLESYRKAALAADLPLICWVESSADPRYEWGEAGATRLPDNPEKLRHSVYTDLAYGVKGIQWFTAGLALSQGPDKVWRRSAAGDDIAVINAELKALGPILFNLTSTDVFHTSPVPPTCKTLPVSYWVGTKNDNVVIGCFEDKNDKPYLMVVNRDWQNKNNITLTFDPTVKGVELFNRSTKKWKSVLKSQNVILDLDKGDGVLLKINR